MDDILRQIIEKIRAREGERFNSFDPDMFTLMSREPPLDILEKMAAGFSVIAEIKKGSPSKGIIRRNYDPVACAKSYAAHGAGAISVVTEESFFYGEKLHLSQVKETIQLPVLRKDFIIHPRQVYESYNLGADCILLIAACLGNTDLIKLFQTAQALGMQSLVEIHNEAELERVNDFNFPLVGINNRDLQTFAVDIQTSLRLRDKIFPGSMVISESGITHSSQIALLKKNGFHGVLVGEALMRQPDCGLALQELLHDQD